MKQDVIPGDRMDPEIDLRLDTAQSVIGAGATQTYVQRFTMAMEFSVDFAKDLLNPANPALADVVSRQGPAKRHRQLFSSCRCLWVNRYIIVC